MITGVVLAGGKSSRFGQDKGMYPYKGKPMVSYAIELLRPVSSQILISAPVTQAYVSLGYEVIQDIYPGCGPLGGIHSALKHAANDRVFILGCDMPLVPLGLIQDTITALEGFQAVIPTHHGLRETLCSAFHKSASEVIEQAVVSGQYKILEALANLKVFYLNAENRSYYNRAIFSNINTLKDLDKL